MKSDQEVVMSIHQKSILISISFIIENSFFKKIIIILIFHQKFSVRSKKKSGTTSLGFLRDELSLMLYSDL